MDRDVNRLNVTSRTNLYKKQLFHLESFQVRNIEQITLRN